MKVVGLTGGIGSGKTTIAKMFEALGVPVYYADDEAKILMKTSLSIKNKLIQIFGSEAYIQNEVNKEFLANIIFHDKEKLHQINTIVHPEVNTHFKQWVKRQNAKYIIQENAILFESSKQDFFDIIITVTAPIELKISRVIERDSTSMEKILARMNNQLTDDFKISHSDYVIYNIDLQESMSQVNHIHLRIMSNL